MPFIAGDDAKQVQEILTKLPRKVKLIYFTQELECQYCRETHQLMEELKELGQEKLELEVYNFVNDKEQVDSYKIDKIPAIAVIADGKDYGIRYYGIPSGYEFSSILEDIQEVARGTPSLSDETMKQIQKITQPLHLQVFVTPTCPYCPSSVLIAHKLAMANDNITADMVEATEFPHLSVKYNVRGVPQTMIGEEHAIEGALPEPNFVERVLEAYQKMYPDN
ncbi:MAG: thioredoxin family protein [Calditrichia bacterium]|nr:thioredoxin family protein [Calditrichia bacterium]